MSEQGLGDVLFFLRFAEPLIKAGALLVLQTPGKIASLLERSGEFSEIVVGGPDVPLVSAPYILICDLPLLTGTLTPLPAWPVLPLPELRSKWAGIIREFGPPPYVGLTWRAGVEKAGLPDFGHRRDPWFKEIDAVSLARAAIGAGATLVALQRNPRPGEIASISSALNRQIHDLTALNDDLEAMTAVLSLLDDYVGVSNTNMHLLAGLGKCKARVLVTYPPHFCWMSEGDSSPWFPGFEVYRQDSEGGWSAALTSLTERCMARNKQES
jgi:hypothetical protein